MDFACRSVRFSASAVLMSGLGAPCPHRDANRRAREGSIAFGHDQTVFYESNKYGIRYNDNVNGFTTPQPIRNGVLPRPYGRCGGHEFLLRKELESGNEFKICRGKRA